MADFADALSEADPDLSLVHSRVVRVGAGAAWFAATAFVLIGLISGNRSLVLQAIGPVLIGAFMTAQILAQRENAYVGLIAAAVGVVVFDAFIGNEETIIPVGVALVIICSLTMVFVETRVLQIVSVVGVSLFSLHMSGGWDSEKRSASGSACRCPLWLPR